MLNIHRPLQQLFQRACYLLPVTLLKQNKSEHLLSLQIFILEVYIIMHTFSPL